MTCHEVEIHPSHYTKAESFSLFYSKPEVISVLDFTI